VKPIHGFSIGDNEWNAALIQIFNSSYEEELSAACWAESITEPKSRKEYLPLMSSGKPSKNSLSNILYSYLINIHERRLRNKPLPNTEEYRSV